MRPLALGALLLVLTASLFGWRALTRPPAPAPEPRSERRPAPPPATPVPDIPRVTRDLLRYEQAQPEPTSRAPRPQPLVTLSPTPSPAAAPAQRLVGFIRRRGALCAALVLPGSATVVALAAGESDAGYTVLTVDEDLGVRLRLPDGGELLLPPPQ